MKGIARNATRFHVTLTRKEGLHRNWRKTSLDTRGTAMEIGQKVLYKQEEGKGICPLTTRKRTVNIPRKINVHHFKSHLILKP